MPDRLNIPESVIDILSRLEAAGYETWCVGGAIRDNLVAGAAQQDVDLATAAPPDVVQALFRRTVPVGVEHGTVGVLDGAGLLHEVTTFRRDIKTDGRHAVVEFGVSLDDDLARRDFTMNAIAFHPLRKEWRDPFNGREDLARGVIRAVGDPGQRFREDRLRILRALRFAARFGFTIEAPTWQAAVEQSKDTGHLSAERVRGEWVRGIATARSLATLVRLWRDSGVAAVWLPECTEPREAGTIRQDHVLSTAFYCTPSATVWRRFKGSVHEIRRAEAIDRGPAHPVDASPRAVRHWMAKVGAATDDLAQLSEWRGDAGSRWTDEMRAIRDREEPTSRGQLALTGDILLAEGFTAGPTIGRILERALEAVLDNPALNTRDALLRLAREVP